MPFTKHMPHSATITVEYEEHSAIITVKHEEQSTYLFLTDAILKALEESLAKENEPMIIFFRCDLRKEGLNHSDKLFDLLKKFKIKSLEFNECLNLDLVSMCSYLKENIALDNLKLSNNYIHRCFTSPKNSTNPAFELIKALEANSSIKTFKFEKFTGIPNILKECKEKKTFLKALDTIKIRTGNLLVDNFNLLTKDWQLNLEIFKVPGIKLLTLQYAYSVPSEQFMELVDNYRLPPAKPYRLSREPYTP